MKALRITRTFAIGERTSLPDLRLVAEVDQSVLLGGYCRKKKRLANETHLKALEVPTASGMQARPSAANTAYLSS